MVRTDGKYIIRLPFRHDLSSEEFLESSRKSAFGQFLRMEKTVEKYPELASSYTKSLAEYLELDQKQPASHTEIYYLKGKPKRSDQYSTLPGKRLADVRLVFNASKKTSSGISLIDILHTGPALQNDLQLKGLRITV